jgi:arylsulfatase A-like enzyme
MKSSRISASLDLSKFSEEEKYMLIVNNRLLNLPIPFVQNMSTPEKLSELRSWTQFQNYQTQLQVLIDSYDAGIRYSDDNLGEFFAFLKELGIWDDTLLIVTSDHGEEFMEHNRIGHGNGLFDTLVRVPLIIKMPAALKIEPQKITELTGVIDIMPTILDVTNHTLEEQMQGKSIMPLAYGQQWDRGSIFASLPNTSMIRTDNSKYIVRKKKNSGAYEKTFYYDLTTDRLEQNNLMIKGKVDVGDLNTTLYKHDESCIELYNERYSQNRDNIEYLLRDKKHVERLKALGYLK